MPIGALLAKNYGLGTEGQYDNTASGTGVSLHRSRIAMTSVPSTAKKNGNTVTVKSKFKILHGPELHERLEELKETANQHHADAGKALLSHMDHCRHAGEALIEAKARTGGRGKWGKWRNANFDGSPEIARIYMRIARNWDHPLFVEARHRYGDRMSIRTFLSLFRKKKLPAAEMKHNEVTGYDYADLTEEAELDSTREDLRKRFAVELRKLTDDEAEHLDRDFYHLWEVFVDSLRERMELYEHV